MGFMYCRLRWGLIRFRVKCALHAKDSRRGFVLFHLSPSWRETSFSSSPENTSRRAAKAGLGSLSKSMMEVLAGQGKQSCPIQIR